MAAEPPVRIKGFTLTPVDAWRVACDKCTAATLVWGANADVDALAWAQSHYRNQHRPGCFE